jgi:hypothetical protein
VNGCANASDLAANKLTAHKPVDVTIHPVIRNEVEDPFVEGDHRKHRRERRNFN